MGVVRCRPAWEFGEILYRAPLNSLSPSPVCQARKYINISIYIVAIYTLCVWSLEVVYILLRHLQHLKHSVAQYPHWPMSGLMPKGGAPPLPHCPAPPTPSPTDHQSRHGSPDPDAPMSSMPAKPCGMCAKGIFQLHDVGAPLAVIQCVYRSCDFSGEVYIFPRAPDEEGSRQKDKGARGSASHQADEQALPDCARQCVPVSDAPSAKRKPLPKPLSKAAKPVSKAARYTGP
jgi:hypothetical protein